MDEKKVNQTIGNASVNYADAIRSKYDSAVSKASAPAASTPAASATPATESASAENTTETVVKPVYTLSDPERVKAINDMYDANANAQKTALQESGAQALSDAQANRDKIAQTYQTQRNMAAVNWERQRRNFLEGANISGVNTGAGSQAELHMMGQGQQQQNTLGYQQAQAEIAAERNIADIQRQTQAAINEAVSKNDYQRAAALLSEYNEIYNRALKKAEALAQYGDFSGYSGIYGDEVAENMKNNWLANNPDLAYAMGLIDQARRDELKSMMGSSGGGGGGGGRARSLPNAEDEYRKQVASINRNQGLYNAWVATGGSGPAKGTNYSNAVLSQTGVTERSATNK